MKENEKNRRRRKESCIIRTGGHWSNKLIKAESAKRFGEVISAALTLKRQNDTLFTERIIMRPDMIEELTACLTESGFTRISTNLPEFVFFYKQEMQSVNVLQVITYENGLYISYDQYDHVKDTITGLFYDKGVRDVHILSLIICDDPHKAMELCRDDRFCWIVDTVSRRLVIYETQVPDFYGYKEVLEHFLMHKPGDIPQMEQSPEARHDIRRNLHDLQKGGWRQLPIVTIALTTINVIVFILCTCGFEMLYNSGDLVETAVVDGKEYYRIFTSMFLHASVSHIGSNMLVLYFLGETIEKQLGHLKYLLLYFASGIGAAGASMLSQYLLQNFTGSIGASGAIYGILGALLWIVIKHRGHFENATLPRILFFIFYSMYSGFTGTNIDNAAHIGGLICGFLLTILLYRRKKR